MSARVKLRSVIVCCVALGPLGLGIASCGGGQPEAATAQAGNEGKAARLLERARADKDVQAYHRLVTRFDHTAAAKEAATEYAALLLTDADEALKEHDWGGAVELAQQARIYGNTAQTRAARKVLTDAENGRAGDVADETAKLAKDGECSEALSFVAQKISGRVRPSFRKQVQTRTTETLVSCITTEMRARLDGGSIDEARMVLETKSATRALSEKAYAQAFAELQKLIVAQQLKELEPLLEERKFAEALTGVNTLAEDGTLTGPERGIARGIIQDRIATILVADSKKAVESRKASKELVTIDETIELVAWKDTPPELEKSRELLVAAAQCEGVRCNFGKPKTMYIMGTPAIRSKNDIERPTGKKLAHGQGVWQVASGRGWILVAASDKAPAGKTRAEALKQATGWIPSKRVQRRETRLRMPPSSDLVGFRVWGPLKAPDKEYLLGVVQSVDGKEANVKRLSDGTVATVKVSSLRMGALEPDQKVKAICGGSHTPIDAKIQKVISGGEVPRVALVCPGKGSGEATRSASALRAKVSWLPRAR